jgi:hypothetical protein
MEHMTKCAFQLERNARQLMIAQSEDYTWMDDKQIRQILLDFSDEEYL